MCSVTHWDQSWYWINCSSSHGCVCVLTTNLAASPKWLTACAITQHKPSEFTHLLADRNARYPPLVSGSFHPTIRSFLSSWTPVVSVLISCLSISNFLLNGKTPVPRPDVFFIPIARSSQFPCSPEGLCVIYLSYLHIQCQEHTLRAHKTMGTLPQAAGECRERERASEDG